MKKLLLGFVLNFSLLTLPAQAQLFRPGGLVLAQGDTLRGEIEDNSWDDAPTEVQFRTGPEAATTRYAPAAVRAFWLRGSRYFRYETLPLDRTAQTTINQLPNTVTHYPHPESFLAEVLVEGSASLLRTAANGVQHYFVRREAQPYLELSERHYLREQEGRTVVADGNNYRAELQKYFGDCPAAMQGMEAVPFTPAGLVAVVQAYNRQCAATRQPGTEYLSPAARPRTGLNIGLVAGGRYGSCPLRTQALGAKAPLDGTNLDAVVHPVGGFYLDLFSPGRHSALHLSGLVTQIGRAAYLKSTVSGLAARLDNKLTILEFRLGGRYFWATTQRERRFFVGVGITVPYATDDKYQPTLIYYNASQQPQAGSLAPDAYPQGLLLPYLEAGVRQGRLTLTLDGRTQRENTQYLFGATPSTLGSGSYDLSEDAYGYRNWYVSATQGLALLRVR